MTEAEFLERWNAEKAAYEAWGDFVLNQIKEAFTQKFPEADFAYFVKIPPVPRAKTNDSLIGKAFHRNKPYRDPYAEIHDKIGLRFVVLLAQHIRDLQAIIEANGLWEASLDRDFERERDERPNEFGYQSKHYVLKAARAIVWHDQTIATGTPCEVQLRTLLQHAHSELTHDNIYKVQSGTPASSKVHRTVAKSMALIETVDDFFERALEELKEATQDEREALQILSALYKRRVGLPPGSDRGNDIVVHTFRAQLGSDLTDRLVRMLDERPFIVTRIQGRYEESMAFRQPWVLLAYLLVSTWPQQTEHDWPLAQEDLTAIQTDLGV